MRGHADLPTSYPPEMGEWFRCYTPNANNKLGHDAMLYLAEEGVRRLAIIAYSVYRMDDSTGGDPAVDNKVGKKMTFGQWPALLDACLSHFSLLDVSRLDGCLPACGRLAVLRDNLKTLKHSRTVDPVVKAFDDSTAPQLGWAGAWGVMVDYRNQTLGHPRPHVVGAQRFYEELTPVVAAAVAELLWNPAVAAVIEGCPIAKFQRRDEHDRYLVRFHDRNGWEADCALKGPEGGELKRDQLLILELPQQRRPRFLAHHYDPEVGHENRRLSGLREPQSSGPRPVLKSLEDMRRGDDVAGQTETSVGNGPPAVSSPRRSHLVVPAEPTHTGHADREATAAVSSLERQLVVVESGRFRTVGGQGRGHEINITQYFSVSARLVTQEVYEAIMGKRPSAFGNPRLPVESVSWLDAAEFCNACSQLAGLEPAYTIEGQNATSYPTREGFRLPTEAEWEYSCRGGHTGDAYGPIDESAWYVGNADGRTHDVGLLTPNGLGVYDMLGNVYEWCGDWFRKGYPFESTQDPPGPAQGFERVLRGGSFLDGARCVNPSYRHRRVPTHRERTCGFRVVRSIPFA